MAEDDEKAHAERELWVAVTKDVKPLKHKKTTPVVEKPAPRKKEKAEKPVLPVSAKAISPITHQPPSLDRRSAERLRKGQMPIEATLDLHGLNRESAYDALVRFITGAAARKIRCVLVITGKGAPEPLAEETGILKQKTPEWLGTPPLRDLVLKVQAAKPKHGGAGAFYVLLRRQREKN